MEVFLFLLPCYLTEGAVTIKQKFQMPLVSMYIYLTLVVAYTYNTSHFHARFGHFNVNSSSSLISSMLNQQYWIMDICCTNQQYLSL